MIQELASAYMYGLASVLHPCALIMSISAMQIVIKLSLEKNKKIPLPIFFIAGNATSLLLLAYLTLAGLAQLTQLSNFLKDFSSLFLGPILILIGMFYSGLIDLNFNRSFHRVSLNTIQSKPLSIFILGLILGISLCPATALLFFGAFIPFAINSDHALWLPIPFVLGISSFLITITAFFFWGRQFLTQHQTLSQRLGKISGFTLILTGIYLSISSLYLN